MSLLDKRLLEFERAPRALLLEEWQLTFKQHPPKNLSTKLMRRAVAYELQVKHLGGLPKAAHNSLRKTALGELKGLEIKIKPPRPQIKPGTKLLREWNGRTYEVEATDTGFVWNKTTYKSLSSIARAITGAHWSGPRFFGLQSASGLKSASDLKSTLDL